jgi:hypothetical protein
LASDFIVQNELPPILQAAESRGTVVLILNLSPSGIKRDKQLSQFQAINPPDKTLVQMNRGERDRTLVKLAETVEAALASEAVGNSTARIDELTGEIQHFLTGKPERPSGRKHWFRIESQGSDIVSKRGEEVYQRVTADELRKKLTSDQLGIFVYLKNP